MKKVKLGDLLEVKRGTTLAGKYYATCGDKIRLTLGNFNYPGGGFKKNISKDNIYFNGPINDEYVLKKGDIITPLTEQVSGLLGETARIPEDNKYVQSGDVALIIPNEEKLDNRFAYYLISSFSVKKQLGAAAQQTKIRHTTPDKIKQCEVWIPDMKQQKKIGLFLDLLNLKITKNNSIAEQLELMVKTIYDYWFLQFEFPNEEGKPYKSSGGKMAWNKELQREIPEKWKVSNLYKNNLTELIKPGVEEFVGTKKYLATADVNGTSYSKGTNVTFTNRESRANMQPTLNSVWFAKMKNSVKHLYFNKELTSIITETILSTGFCGLQCDEYSFEYLVSFIGSDYFEKVKNQLAHGATQQAVNNSDLKNIKMVIPSKRILNKFHELTKDIFNLISEKKVENSELASLRNLLLPLLMNGQVTIGE